MLKRCFSTLAAALALACVAMSVYADDYEGLAKFNATVADQAASPKLAPKVVYDMSDLVQIAKTRTETAKVAALERSQIA